MFSILSLSLPAGVGGVLQEAAASYHSLNPSMGLARNLEKAAILKHSELFQILLQKSSGLQSLCHAGQVPLRLV